MPTNLTLPLHFCTTGKHICVRCLGTVGCEEYFENDHMHVVCSEESVEFPLSSPSYFENFRPVDRVIEESTGLVDGTEAPRDTTTWIKTTDPGVTLDFGLVSSKESTSPPNEK